MLNFTFEALEGASSSLKRINDFLYELKNRPFEEGGNKNISRLVEDTNKKFIAGLGDDLNISVALRALFEMIRKANILISQGKVYRKDREKLISSLLSLDNVLAVLPREEEETLSSKFMKKIEEREKARTDKNYELADQMRQELLKEGIVLEDTKDGVRWKVVKSKE
jgi:cysteinyl-tRNA synthetase